MFFLSNVIMHQMRNHLIVQIAKRVNLVLARLMGGIQAGEEWSRAGDSKSLRSVAQTQERGAACGSACTAAP